MNDFQYFWRVRTRYPERFGQKCRVLARGKMNSQLVEFEDGFKTITSRNYTRKAKMITTDGDRIKIKFNDFSIENYELFKNVKRLPESKLEYDYENDSYTVETHVRYSNLLGFKAKNILSKKLALSGFLFEHQREIVKLAMLAKMYAVWADCGLGKTLIELEFARQINAVTGGRTMILTLPEVALQTIEECKTFYGKDLPILFLESKTDMRRWCEHGDNVYKLAITNYEKMNTDEKDGQIIPELKFLSGLIVDENRLKGGGGNQKWTIIKSSKGVPYKMTATATPAPNDYIEFASQASFLERLRSENEIIWTFFAKDKVTGEWTVKRHAKEAFFEWMSAWSIYVRDPRAYGWSFDVELPPEPEFIRHEIDITDEQANAAQIFNVDKLGQASLFSTSPDMVGRSKLSQIAKGFVYEKNKSVTRIPSRKPKFVADLISKEMIEHQVLVWTLFDEESEILLEEINKNTTFGFSFAALTGKTPTAKRAQILEDYRHGHLDCLISNSKLLGYGMNLQMTGSMIFSGWNDSFEEWYQTIRRAVRFGNKKRVRIHIPFIPELELAQLENVFKKEAKFIDGIEQQEKAYIKAMKGMKLL